jgi:hypothetical protein
LYYMVLFVCIYLVLFYAQFCTSILSQVTLRTTMEISLFDFLCYSRNFLCIQCYNIVFYVLYFYVHEFWINSNQKSKCLEMYWWTGKLSVLFSKVSLLRLLNNYLWFMLITWNTCILIIKYLFVFVNILSHFVRVFFIRRDVITARRIYIWAS